MPQIRMKSSEHLPDAELVKNIVDGQSSLFEILIRRNNPVLYKVGRSYNYTHHDVEDLMQETYVAAFINLSKFEGRSSFKTWLVRIMINQCLARMQRYSFRNEKADETKMNDNQMPMFVTRNVNDTGKKVSNKELNYIIENSIASLPVDYRMVFSLREITGLSIAETSEALDISEANVKVRLTRAKSMLRQSIEKMYTPEDIFEFNLIYCDKMVARVMGQINKLCQPG
jgi:RNA polymerase sigma factor (sigma-70 family)